MRRMFLAFMISLPCLAGTDGIGFGLAQAQSAQPPKLIGSPSTRNAKVSDSGLFAIEIRCTALAPLDDPSGAFVSRNRSLFVLVTTGTPAINAATASDKLPSDALAAMEIYSIGTDRATNTFKSNDFRDCKRSFLVRGDKKLKIVTTENYIDNYDQTVFGDVLSGILGVISPLFSLLTGGPLPALVAGNLTDAATVRSNVTKILNALNQGFNKTKSAGLGDQLRIGTYTFQTDYVRFAVKVRPVTSIVLDTNREFVQDFIDKVNGTSLKLDSTKIDDGCRGARFDISRLGFRSSEDISFGLLNLASHAGFSKSDSIKCLTAEYAFVAVRSGNRFWGNFAEEFRFNKDEVGAVFPDEFSAQPKWPKVKGFMNDLAVSLGQFYRNDPPPAAAISDLEAKLAPQLSIIDKSSSVAIGSDTAPAERFLAIKRLAAKGYIRVGCVAPTTNADGDVDGATAIFLIVKATNEATRAPLDSVLVVRPFFKDNRIDAGLDRLVISDNRAWMTAALTSTRDYDCNGFSIDKPTRGPSQ